MWNGYSRGFPGKIVYFPCVLENVMRREEVIGDEMFVSEGFLVFIIIDKRLKARPLKGSFFEKLLFVVRGKARLNENTF
jgi:hypothetical protein